MGVDEFLNEDPPWESLHVCTTLVVLGMITVKTFAVLSSLDESSRGLFMSFYSPYAGALGTKRPTSRETRPPVKSHSATAACVHVP